MSTPYTLAQIKSIKWGVLEENQPIHLSPVMYPGWCSIIKNTGKILGMYQKNIASIYVKDWHVIFVDHKEWTRLGAFALQKILKSQSWGIKLNKNIIKLSDKLVHFTNQKIYTTNLRNKSNKEIAKLYTEYSRLHNTLYDQAIIPVYLDLYKPHLTNYLTDYLNKKIKKINYQITAKEFFAQLTVPVQFSQVQEEEIGLLKLAEIVRRASEKQITNVSRKKIEHHIQAYRYLAYNFEGPAFPNKYFWKRLKKFVSSNISPQDKIKLIKSEKIGAQKNYQKIIKKLSIDAKHRRLFDLTKGFIFSKDYRKMSLVRSYYESEKLLKEIGCRLNLSLAQVRNCLPSEINDMLIKGAAKPLKLAQRMRGLFFVVVDGRLPGQILVDKTYFAMKKYLIKKEDLTEINCFHGQPACLGRARGKIKIINSQKDQGKMKRGDILVSQMTNPNLVPAMKKASAIITDLGGVTCHAAIVSRELNIPCVIGTKIATRVLKDGDKVEVDATTGTVKKI